MTGLTFDIGIDMEMIAIVRTGILNGLCPLVTRSPGP